MRAVLRNRASAVWLACCCSSHSRGSSCRRPSPFTLSPPASSATMISALPNSTSLPRLSVFSWSTSTTPSTSTNEWCFSSRERPRWWFLSDNHLWTGPVHIFTLISCTPQNRSWEKHQICRTLLIVFSTTATTVYRKLQLRSHLYPTKNKYGERPRNRSWQKNITFRRRLRLSPHRRRRPASNRHVIWLSRPSASCWCTSTTPSTFTCIVSPVVVSGRSCARCCAAALLQTNKAVALRELTVSEVRQPDVRSPETLSLRTLWQIDAIRRNCWLTF